MKKKLLSVLLCAAMAVSMMAGCGSDTKADPTPTAAPTTAPTEAAKEPEATATPVPTTAPTEAPAPAGEALPEAKYYFSFDGDATGIEPRKNVNDSNLTTLAERVFAVDETFMFTNGVKNQCLWLDGNFGAQVTGISALNSDTYTLSFWMWASRLSNYGTTLQFGSGMAQSTTEHWLSFTTLNATETTATFPTLWNRDAATGAWPFPSYEDGKVYGKKEWAHVVLVCDETDVIDYNGTPAINAKLYINGVPSANEIQIVPGIFTDNGDWGFLLGVNPWDAIFKGAIDELYVFDQALTAGQVATLYADGDASKDPENPAGEVEGRDHSDVVMQGYTVGSLDCTTAAGTVYTDTKAIPVGATVEIEFANYTKGETFEDTYALILQNVGNAHNTTDNAAYKEHAVVSGAVFNNAALESYLTRNTFNQFNPKIYGDNTDRANFVAAITNNGTTVDVSITATCADGVTRYLEYAGIPVEGEVYACLTTAGGFLDYLPDIMIKGTQVGNVDFSSGFWGAHSEAVLVPAGETRTTRLINYTKGAAAFQNYVVVLKNVAGLNETEGYAEYAVVRADNYGWAGALNTNANLAELGWTMENTWGEVSGLTSTGNVIVENEPAFCADMSEATVDVAVTNNGTTAEVVATITTKDGKVFTQKYGNIAVSGDLYFGFTTDGTCLDLLGTYNGTAVGAMDGTTGFWGAHSEPVAVPNGESVTQKFICHQVGTANWNNFAVVLQNVAKAHGTAEDPAYAEYAVVRADAYGWAGALNTNANLADLGWVFETNWDAATLANDLKDATVEVTVTNNTTTAEILAKMTTVDGRELLTKCSNVAISGDLYFCYTVDLSWLDILN